MSAGSTSHGSGISNGSSNSSSSSSNSNSNSSKRRSVGVSMAGSGSTNVPAALMSPDTPGDEAASSSDENATMKHPRITKEIERLVAFNVVLDSFRTPSSKRVEDDTRRSRNRISDAPDPIMLLNLPQKKVPRKLLTRPNGVGIERIVVFVDPLNDDDDYWRPAMVVPTVEWESNMDRVKPGHCVIRYFDNNSYGIVSARDLSIFSEDMEPFKMFSKLGNQFFEDKGVKSALRLLRTGVLPNGFKWPTWDPNDTSAVEERLAGKQRSVRAYKPSTVEDMRHERAKKAAPERPTARSASSDSASEQRPASENKEHRDVAKVAPNKITDSVMERYHEFMRKRGTPVHAVPNVAKHAINAQALLQAVTSRGGMEEVALKELWMTICRELEITRPTIAMSYIMRHRYLRYFYLFEVEFMRTPKAPIYLRALDRPFEPGDKIVVFHEQSGREYDAKILDCEMDTTKWDFTGRYYVHYNGWNSNYDEWIPHEYVVSLHPDDVKHVKTGSGRRLSLPDVREIEDADALSRRSRTRTPNSDSKIKKEQQPTDDERIVPISLTRNPPTLKRRAGDSASGTDDASPAMRRRVSPDDTDESEVDGSWRFKRKKLDNNSASPSNSQTSTSISAVNGFTVNSPLLFYGTERSTRSKVALTDVPFHYIPDPNLSAMDTTSASQESTSSLGKVSLDKHGRGKGYAADDQHDDNDDDNEDGDDDDDEQSDDDENDDASDAGSKSDRKRASKRPRRSRTSRQKRRRLQERVRQQRKEEQQQNSGWPNEKTSEQGSDEEGKDAASSESARDTVGTVAMESDGSLSAKATMPPAPTELFDYKAAAAAVAITFTFNIYEIIPEFDNLPCEMRTKKIEERMEYLRTAYKQYQAKVRRCDARRHKLATSTSATNHCAPAAQSNSVPSSSSSSSSSSHPVRSSGPDGSLFGSASTAAVGPHPVSS